MSQGVEIAGLVINLPSWTTYAAVAVAGLAGAVSAARRGFDAIGVLGISVAAAVGGLLLRDILLQQGTPVVLTHPTYLITAAMTAIFGFFFAGLISRISGILVILDGLAMGFLCTVGANVTLKAGLSWSSAILLGVLTAVGGTIIGDVLSGTAPRIVRPGSFVAIAALVSTTVFVGLIRLGMDPSAAQLIAMIVALGLRTGSHFLGWGTGPAADLSDRVWNYWYRRKKKVADLTVKQSQQHFRDSDVSQ